MKHLRVLNFFAAIAMLLFTGSCKKENNNGNGTARNVKYELTGNATGKMNIVYYDAQGNATTLTNITLPWTKEITAATTTAYAGITVTAVVNGGSSAGQTITAKLYSGGSVKKSQSATVDNNGYFNIGPLMFYF